jgi:hypothetical protein
MAAVPLKILIHGLIALVPTTDTSGVHRMTALLVDGRMSPQSHEEACMSDHHPKLQFFVEEPRECLAVDGCDVTGNLCTCAYDPDRETTPDPLVGKQIRLEILPLPVLATEKPGNSLPERSLPGDSQEAGKISYVANLSQKPFDLTVDPDYLIPNPTAEARAHVVTRMEIPYKDITACNLATREDGGEANVHAMSLRPLHSASDSGEVSYAMAERVVAELIVPDSGDGGQIVKLHISDLGGENDHSMALQAGSDAYRIDISNDAIPLGYDDPCDDGVGRHFAHYFALALDPTDDLPIPHVRPTQFRSATPLQPATCKDPVFDIESRPICPMAIFNP